MADDGGARTAGSCDEVALGRLSVVAHHAVLTGSGARRTRASAAIVVLVALAAGLLPSPASGAPGAWSVTGKLATARRSHAAVQLVGGKVLVIGGEGRSGALASTEVYRPDVRTWAPGGSLATARYRHTATLLGDGRVLVVGGRSNTGPLATAEVYDPVARTWSPAGALTTGPRYWHTATLLADGRVLVTGGLTGQEVAFGNSGIRGELVSLQTAEVWSPSTGVFTAVTPMADARDSHSATLLGDGRVLVAGGYGVNSAELFDPAGGSWSMTGSMSRVRREHAAALLPDGTVLVAGGCCPTASTERYDPASGSWSVVSPLASGRWGHSATVLSSAACAPPAPPAWCGKVLVAGGYPNPQDPLASSELWDESSGAWVSVGSLRFARVGHTATLLKKGGKVLVVGGEGGDGPVRSAEIFAPPPG